MIPEGKRAASGARRRHQRQVAARAAAAVLEAGLGGEETALRDTGAMMGWENYLRSRVATKTSPWRGERAAC